MDVTCKEHSETTQVTFHNSFWLILEKQQISEPSEKKMQIEIACNILEDYIVCFNAYQIITLNFDLCAIQWLSTHYDKYPSTPKIFLHMWNKFKIPRGQLCAHTTIWHPVNSFPWLLAVTFGTFTSFSIPSQISSDTDWKPGNLLPSAPSLVFSCHTQYFKC